MARRSRTKVAPLALLIAASGIAVTQPAIAADPQLSLDLGAAVRLDLVLVHAGTFTQGSPPDEPGRNADEASRQVTLSTDYYIGKTPVTVGQFKRFTSESGYKTESERGSSGGFGWDGNALVQRKDFTWRSPGFDQDDDSPVVLVTYDDALAFDDWLARKSGRRIELPTEAQWEYAARAGTTTRYYLGNDDNAPGRMGWFAQNAGDGTRKVAQKQANAFGLFDMGGNVWQWCRDYYGPYEARPVKDPLVTTSPSTEEKPRRVLRGGSWLKDAKNMRSAARYRNAPGSRNADNGFRIIASLDAESPASGAPPGSGPSEAPAGDPPGAVTAGMCACTALPVMGIALIIVFALLRSRSKAPGGGGSGGGGGAGISEVSWFNAADGFVVKAPPHLRGRNLSYRVRIHGRWVPGTILLDGAPGGQFVYTGGTPEIVELERTEPFQAPFGGSANGSPGYGRGGVPGSTWGSSGVDEASRNDPHEPFRGYPSAY